MEHTTDVKRFNKLGDEAQGASHHQCSDMRGAYTEARVRFSHRCRGEGKGQWLKVVVKEILIRDMEKKYAHQ